MKRVLMGIVTAAFAVGLSVAVSAPASASAGEEGACSSCYELTEP